MEQMGDCVRVYRRAVPTQTDWHSFVILYRESDLWIQADKEMREEAQRLLLEARMVIEGYCDKNPRFLITHVPMALDPLAPPLIRAMLEAALAAQVGPMAAVAGAIAQYVGEGLLETGCEEVVVENGGDLYLSAKRPLLVGIHAGSSPLSDKVAILVQPQQMPLGIATSSATVGHSISYGKADASCIVASNSVLADAVATSLGNKINESTSLHEALDWAMGIEGVLGAVVVRGKNMGVKGNITLVPVR